jgi:chromosome segregation ATPase
LACPFRRILGPKKDSFFIGRKSSSPREFFELLNSAGVLTSNPYHIVRQGEINSLAEATPAARLKLLEDFAGASKYKVKWF